MLEVRTYTIAYIIFTIIPLRKHIVNNIFPISMYVSFDMLCLTILLMRYYIGSRNTVCDDTSGCQTEAV